MSTAANATTSSLQPEQLNAVAADCVALEQIRVFRQLLVVRCGVVTVVIAVIGLLLGLLHTFAYWFSVGIFAGAPAATWIVERQRERSLRKKVVKSS